VILKLDFEKAFDKLEHQVIIQVMKHKGFLVKWIENIIGSGSSSIILMAFLQKPSNAKEV